VLALEFGIADLCRTRLSFPCVIGTRRGILRRPYAKPQVRKAAVTLQAITAQVVITVIKE
jgi:hypothetical protein